MTTPSALTIGISVRPNQTLAFLGAFTPELFCANVERYAANLASQLGLPLVPRVALSDAEDDSEFLPGEQFRLRIGDTLARTALHSGDRSSAADAVWEVSTALFTNRLALVRSADVARIRSALRGVHAEIGDDDLLRAVRHLVGNGVRASRLQLPSDADERPQRLDDCHDEALDWEVECHPVHADELRKATDELRETLGVPLPPAAIGAANVDDDVYRLRINDVWLPPRRVRADPEDFGVDAAYRTASASLRAPLERDLARHAPLFVSDALADLLLSSLRRTAEPLVDGVRQRFPIGVVADVFRALLAEGFPVSDLRGVLEAMLTATGRTTVSDRQQIVFLPHTGGMLLTDGPMSDEPLAATELVEIVRARHARSIMMRLAAVGRTVSVYLADPAFEAAVLGATQASGDSTGAHDRELVRRVVAVVPLPDDAEDQPRLIAVSAPVRRWLRELIHIELPQVYPLNWSEFPGDSAMTVAGRITG